jgi:hypothetical protein
MSKFAPRRIEDILSKAEMSVYARHIEDGMDFPALVGEFNAGPFELYMQFRAIEDKLKEAFRHA